MMCSTATCVLTAVLTLHLLPDSSDFVFIARVFSTSSWHQVMETMPRNVVPFSKTIVEQHFKSFNAPLMQLKVLSCCQHAYSKYCDKIAAIVVKLPADMEMLCSKKQFLAC
jgi:hypothetical protein